MENVLFYLIVLLWNFSGHIQVLYSTWARGQVAVHFMCGQFRVVCDTETRWETPNGWHNKSKVWACDHIWESWENEKWERGSMSEVSVKKSLQLLNYSQSCSCPKSLILVACRTIFIWDIYLQRMFIHGFPSSTLQFPSANIKLLKNYVANYISSALLFTRQEQAVWCSEPFSAKKRLFSVHPKL